MGKLGGTILGAGIFLIIQLFYSSMLFNRPGNLPPSPDDSYGYIFSIEKPFLFKSFFPRMPSFGLSVNFEYLSYSVVFGAISWLLRIPAESLYFASFFAGKLLLLGCALYLIKALEVPERLQFWVLAFWAVYAGTGAVHGFFWVVPSFWFMLSFILLTAVYFDKKNRSRWLIATIIIFNVTAHKLAIPMAVTWIVLEVITKLKGPNTVFIRNFYFLALAVFLGIQVIVGKLDTGGFALGVPSPAAADRIDLSKSSRVYQLVPNLFRYMPANIKGMAIFDYLAGLDDIKLNLSKLEPLNKKISRLLPPYLVYLHILAGPFMPLLPMFIIAYFYLRAALRETKPNLVKYKTLILASIITAFGFVWHPFGYRTLWWTAPLIYGGVGMGIGARSRKWWWVGGGILIWLLLFRFNLESVWLTAKANPGEWEPKKCYDYISNSTFNRQGDLYFTSQTGINAFLANGFSNWVVKPYMGIKSVKLQTDRNVPFFIVTQTQPFEPETDADFIDNPIEEVGKNLPRWDEERMECGYFAVSKFIPD